MQFTVLGKQKKNINATKMKIVQELSAHRTDGWQGQYNRMIRWGQKLKELENEDKSGNKTDFYFDVLYAAFQNVFFLKDWLKHDAGIPNEDLNIFINENKEIGICRDICNGTKHFEINHPSVDAEFGIIREYDPRHKTLNQAKFKIVILTGGEKIEPYRLIERCIGLWDSFIKSKLYMIKRKT